MKRQAEGVCCETIEDAETEVNGNKRIKLLSNEATKGSTEEKSVMDVLQNENSHNHDDHSPSVSNNKSTGEHGDATFEKNIENHSTQNVNEPNLNDIVSHVANNNCNGSQEEAIVKVSTNDSGIVSEFHHSNSHENSVMHAEENPEDADSVPPILNHCDHDLQSSESTDSYQSGGFEAESCTSKSNSEVSEKHASQAKNEGGKESSFKSDVKKNIDADNLTLSHLKVTELEGHTDTVFSVAADEDFIVSASADTTVKVWNLERHTAVSTFSGHSATVTSLLLLNPSQSKVLKKKLSLTKVSRIAVTGSLDCHIKLWSVLEGKELASFYTFNGITCIDYLESDCLVVVGTEGGKLELWDLVLAKAIISVRAHEDEVTDVKVKDNYIFSVSLDGTVKVWSYEDDDIYPVYTRKRKEISSDKTGFRPAQWKTLTVSDNVMYLGDNTNNVKALDWRAGRLILYKNESKEEGACDCVVAKKNMLFSTCYDPSTDTGGVNVWKLPEMTYVCTITGAVSYIGSLAVVQKDNKLKIICGGHSLSVFEFDFTRPPSAEGDYRVCELETVGHEINENSVEIQNAGNKSISSNSNESSSSNRWCRIM